MNNGLITRADDFGSAKSANEAILEALGTGYFIRNVSCMAVGPSMEADAAALAAYGNYIDIGLHFTLNAEWDTVKWLTCAPKNKIISLLDSEGHFYQTRQGLVNAKPNMDEIMLELNAQLDRLSALGLPVTYVDTHMAPDETIAGLSDCLREWAEEKGLLYVKGYYSFPSAGMPEFAPTEQGYQKNVVKWLDSFEDNSQYLYFMHPAKMSPETQAFSNVDFPAGVVAHERELEYRSAISAIWQERVEERKFILLRYREAKVPIPEA